MLAFSQLCEPCIAVKVIITCILECAYTTEIIMCNNHRELRSREFYPRCHVVSIAHWRNLSELQTCLEILNSKSPADFITLLHFSPAGIGKEAETRCHSWGTKISREFFERTFLKTSKTQRIIYTNLPMKKTSLLEIYGCILYFNVLNLSWS